MKHLNLRVRGQVQGIFYRVSAKAEAEKLGITGFARNEPDGSVYLEIEGELEPLAKFVAWCQRGPKGAVVEKVETSEGPVEGCPGFEVRSQ